MNKPQAVNYRSGCPIARTLDVMGDKWTLVIMREALFFEARTFADFSRMLEKVPGNLLSDRLKKRVELELLKKVACQQHPERFKYVPTKRADELKPVLKAMRKFGENHLGGQVKRKK